MTPNRKKNWLAALRSGKYRHGADQMFNRRENTYCCLGVLAEISPGIAKKKVLGNGYVTYESVNNKEFKSNLMLSNKDLELLGLPRAHAVELSSLNDQNTNYDKAIEYIKVNL